MSSIKYIILVNAEGNYLDDVFNIIKSRKEVESIEKTFGAYDFVVKIKEMEDDKFNEFKQSRIRKNDGVRSTITLRIIER